MFCNITEEKNNALEPSVVRFAHGTKVERGLAGKTDAAFVALANVRRISIVPNVDRDFDALLLPLNNIRYSKSVRKIKHTPKHRVFAQIC